MFCKNCGKEIDDKAAICVYCGVPTKAECEEKEKTNGFGIAGFVVSLVSLWLGSFYCIASIVGLVLSIIGMSKSKVCGKCNGLAVAGLVIGIISLVIWGIIWILVRSGIIAIASNLYRFL